MGYLVFIGLATLGLQVATAQVLRPPFHLLNRPEPIIEPPCLPAPSPTVISEPPINSVVPLPSVISEPSTTIITDCSPTICQNLANTIQLMIVCNLLQRNMANSELAMQLAAPIINEVLTSPTLSCGCANPLSPTVTPNLLTPNVVSPNLIPNSIVAPNILGANGISLPPRVVTPNCGCPNSVMPSVPAILPSLPIADRIGNANGLLGTLMGLLGNIQG